MKDPMLTVSPAPHWHIGKTFTKDSYYTILALIPALIMGVINYGKGSVGVVGLSVFSAMATEALMQAGMRRPITIHDGNALLIGLLLSFLLPAGAPWWLVVVGASVAIIVGKQLYGGLGSNPFNPVLVGWIIIRISWKLEMDVDASLVDVASVSGLSPLASLRTGVFELGLRDVMLGRIVGSVGSASFLILLAGVVLGALKVIKWEVSVSFLVGAFLASLLLGPKFFTGLNPGSISPITFIFVGHVMLGAFFLAPDNPSSPVNTVGRYLYGFLAGFMAIVIRVYSSYPDGGVIFAIILLNLSSPLLDRIRPKAVGKA